MTKYQLIIVKTRWCAYRLESRGAYFHGGLVQCSVDLLDGVRSMPVHPCSQGVIVQIVQPLRVEAQPDSPVQGLRINHLDETIVSHNQTEAFSFGDINRLR